MAGVQERGREWWPSVPGAGPRPRVTLLSPQLLEAQGPPRSAAPRGWVSFLFCSHGESRDPPGNAASQKTCTGRKRAQSGPRRARTPASFVCLRCGFMRTTTGARALGGPERHRVPHAHFTDRQAEANQQSTGSGFPRRRNIPTPLSSAAFRPSWAGAGRRRPGRFPREIPGESRPA